MKNYGRFFNNKSGFSAVLLLTGGIMIFAAILYAVKVIEQDPNGVADENIQRVAKLFILCSLFFLMVLILFLIWNVRIRSGFKICRMNSALR